MTLFINSLMPRVQANLEHIDTQAFLETHLHYLLTTQIVQQELVDESEAVVFRGDYFGLLSSLRVPLDLHYIVMRINGFLNSADFTGGRTLVLIPDSQAIYTLVNVFQTRSQNTNQTDLDTL